MLDLLRQRVDYEAAARQLGIPPGKAYMIATGIPADGSDGLAPEDLQREGFLAGGSQRLLGIPARNPTEPEELPQVTEWVKKRARSDGQMQNAGIG